MNLHFENQNDDTLDELITNTTKEITENILVNAKVFFDERDYSMKLDISIDGVASKFTDILSK